MSFVISILLIILAGIINGSFVIPARYLKNFSTEKTWFYHSIIGVFMIPWLFMVACFPESIKIYAELPLWVILSVLGTGLIFGAGQICFARSIDFLGIALAFTINIGLGLILGSLFVVYFNHQWYSWKGILVSTAVLLILLSLILNYFSGKTDHRLSTASTRHQYLFGWILAIITGITSGLQNIGFVTISSYTKEITQNVNAFWIWPIFLTAATLPMLIGFYYRIKISQKSSLNIAEILHVKNLFLVIIMGLFFTGSLVLYSLGMHHLTLQTQIVGWPTLMLFIIASSQCWGLVYKEYILKINTKLIYRILGVLLLIISIILLASVNS